MTPQTGDHHHHINPRCIYAARCARGPAHGVHPRSEDRAAQALHRVKSPALFLSSSYPLPILFLSLPAVVQFRAVLQQEKDRNRAWGGPVVVVFYIFASSTSPSS